MSKQTMGTVVQSEESEIMDLLKQSSLNKKSLMPLPEREEAVEKGLPESVYPYFSQLHKLIKEPTFRGLGSHRFFTRDLRNNIADRIILYKTFLTAYGEVWDKAVLNKDCSNADEFLKYWQYLMHEEREKHIDGNYLQAIIQETANSLHAHYRDLDNSPEKIFDLAVDYPVVADLWLGKIKLLLYGGNLKESLDNLQQSVKKSSIAISEQSLKDMKKTLDNKCKSLKSGQRVSHFMQSALQQMKKQTGVPILDTPSEYIFIKEHQNEARMQETLGIDGILWGSALGKLKSQKQYILNQTAQILHEIAFVLDIPRYWVGLGKAWGREDGISLAFGIGGVKDMNAFYRQDCHSLHFKGNDSDFRSFIHEWFHALDYTIGNCLVLELNKQGWKGIPNHLPYSELFCLYHDHKRDDHKIRQFIRGFNPHLTQMMDCLITPQRVMTDDVHFIDLYKKQKNGVLLDNLSDCASFLLLKEFKMQLQEMEISIIQQNADRALNTIDIRWVSNRDLSAKEICQQVLDVHRESLMFLSENNWEKLHQIVDDRLNDKIRESASLLATKMFDYVRECPDGIDFSDFEKRFLIPAPTLEAGKCDDQSPLYYSLQIYLDMILKDIMGTSNGKRAIICQAWEDLATSLQNADCQLKFKNHDVLGIWERSKKINDYFGSPVEIFARLGEALFVYSQQNITGIKGIIQLEQYIQPYEDKTTLTHLKKGIQYHVGQGFDLNPEEFSNQPVCKEIKAARHETIGQLKLF